MTNNTAVVLPQDPGIVRIEAFVSFYNSLNANNLHGLSQVYHPDVTFIDPVHQIQGLPALKDYFVHAYERLTQSHFEALHMAAHGEIGFVSWKMRIRHPAIAKGEEIVVDGCSELRWHTNGLIIAHRDYFDLTQMVYQHLPVIGWLTSKVKQQMAKDK
jgi:ketosteroid isomerase-like protein